MKAIIKAAFALVVAISASAALAHAGGTDENGCHETKSGKFHCHIKKDARDRELDDSKERHRKFCRGLPDIPNSAPRWDAYGKPCKGRK